MQTRTLDGASSLMGNGAVRAISFDVFDTFLMRRCTTPEGVFELACRHAPVAWSRPGLIESYVQHRQQAEAKAHLRAVDLNGSPEIPIADIYAEFPFRLFGLDRSAAPDLIGAELRAERELCFANPDIAALYLGARRQGLKVGFLSDTYWNGEQLAELLAHCLPSLRWDFLYASSDHGTGKREGLFERYLAEQDLAAGAAVHIGDNEKADIEGARRCGIQAIHVRQASDHLASVLQREQSAIRLYGSTGASARLDNGLRTIRRLVARADRAASAFATGRDVVGPIMAAFDRFVADRVAALSRQGCKIAVAFLARDGMLSFDIWRAMRSDPASYVEINRRVAVIGSAATLAPLVKLFRSFPAVDADTVAAVLDLRSARLTAFFATCPGGRCSGEQFAEAMPKLIDADEVATLSAEMRRELLSHLRIAIPEFDACTDLVLVDLGYCGTIQKALRDLLDHEGITTRLHGLYLLSFDDALAELAETDAAEGFISDLVVKPRVNRVMARNATLLEHVCCAPQGSVRSYRNGRVVREHDPRPADQLGMCSEVQAGALHFVGRLERLKASDGLDPFSDLDAAASWAAAMLARFLLLPTDDELARFGQMRHDVNLGTQTLVATADSATADLINVAHALPMACIAAEPPMWLAGTLAALSPAHGFFYALFGAGHLPGDVFGDVRCGTMEVTLMSAECSRRASVSCFRTGLGGVRVRIPVSRNFSAIAAALPLDRIAPAGLIEGVTVQFGKTVAEAMASRDIRPLTSNRLAGTGLEFSGRHYRTVEGQRHELLIALPVLNQPIAVVTVLITPLGNARAAALDAMPHERSETERPPVLRRPNRPS